MITIWLREYISGILKVCQLLLHNFIYLRLMYYNIVMNYDLTYLNQAWKAYCVFSQNSLSFCPLIPGRDNNRSLSLTHPARSAWSSCSPSQSPSRPERGICIHGHMGPHMVCLRMLMLRLWCCCLHASTPTPSSIHSIHNERGPTAVSMGGLNMN